MKKINVDEREYHHIKQQCRCCESQIVLFSHKTLKQQTVLMTCVNGHENKIKIEG